MLKIPPPRKIPLLLPQVFDSRGEREAWLDSHDCSHVGSIGPVEVWLHHGSSQHVLAVEEFGSFVIRVPDRKEVPNETKIQQHML